jgi:hypothetical protein
MCRIRRAQGCWRARRQESYSACVGERGARGYCPLAIAAAPHARALLPRMAGKFSGAAVVANPISTGLRGRSARRQNALSNTGIATWWDEARPAAQARRAKANSLKATTVRLRREPIFPGARRDSGRSPSKRNRDARPRPYRGKALLRRAARDAEPVKRPPTRREDIFRHEWLGRGEASKSANAAVDLDQCPPAGICDDVTSFGGRTRYDYGNRTMFRCL